ncbi:nitronate monooxygenase [Scopulibacillus darangshiensis]|uniref:Probable nitronate monooxygenase n=1 Tax=Scopulibacillus darangshiensis TaxID=442528 RepID=A0A4R2PAD1_9BACL|nr:nitronate monooxygenase [Scopulibacillus darangshiensis]TCP31328.1 nitronate monooxygenase [Scopulibacillus darangshiensis]
MRTKLPAQIADQITLPVIAAPMFLVSSPELVIEGCKSGIIGSFPLLNARTTEILEDWMRQITSELEKAKKDLPKKKIAPWAVNLIVHRSNRRYETDLELIKSYKPPIVITSLGDPARVVDIVHEYGGLVFSDVSNLTHAKKAADRGSDGLILVSSGAGGHAGTINPMAFVAAVREFWDGTIILAGSISKGQDVLASEVLGADLAYMGTRFIAASESMAKDGYKNMLIDASAEDIIYTDAVSGVNANFLIPSILNAGLDLQKLRKKETIDFSHLDEAKAWKNIWSAGHGVGSIKQIQRVTEIVRDLKREYSVAKECLNGEESL